MSTANAFSLLDGDDSGWTQTSKGKKKSKKKTSSAVEQTTQAEVPISKDDANDENGAAARGFQVVKRTKNPAKSSGAVANGNGAAMDGAALEKVAMETKSGEGRTILINEWQAKIRSDQAFRTVILKSQAVERLIEGMTTISSLDAEAMPLGELLSSIAHPSTPFTLPQAVADLIIMCGILSPQDPLAPKSQAAAAGSAAVAVIKQGIPLTAQNNGGSSSSNGISALETLQARLESLEIAFGRAVTSKDQARVATQLFEAAREGADLGNPDSVASVFPAAAAALSSLESLHSALTARHKMLTAQDGASVEEQAAAAQHAHSMEDASLATKEAEADALVADLEQKLAAARAAAQEIKTRRAAAKQILQQTVEGLARGAAASAACAAKITSSLETALEQADKVNTVLHVAVKTVSASADEGKELSKKWVESGLAGRFTATTVQQLEASVKYLRELGSKSAFYRERLDASTRQGEQLTMLKDTTALVEHKKQRKSLEGLLSDSVTAAIAVERSTQATVEAWRARQGRLRRQGGAAAIPAGAAEKIEALAADAVQIGEDIAAGRTVQAALPPKPQRNNSKIAGSASEMSGRTSPGSSSVAMTAASGEDTSLSMSTSSELAILEQRLAALEKENKKKDAQIAAMMAAASVDIPSPAPMPKKM
ncbi:hypothetical protein Ndes2526B_g06797 [Nannochloris sp. 'desiccata']|nr:hypothetical protein KSW81_005099 [Chlorella desiccata (nom. nud.)]KAH7617905.1 hypothetical protein NADE_000108 [Chlorella desiccata (nom. nud.)]